MTYRNRNDARRGLGFEENRWVNKFRRPGSIRPRRQHSAWIKKTYVPQDGDPIGGEEWQPGGDFANDTMGNPVSSNHPGVGPAQIAAGTLLVVGTGAVVGTEVAAGGILSGIKKLLGFKPAARALSKSEEKAIDSLNEHIAEHVRKIANFKSNPTVRPGMEHLPKAKIEAQQARRLEHYQQEIDAARKNIQDILNGTSNAGK